MKFTGSRVVSKKFNRNQYATAIWNPRAIEWRDVIEDYLTISRKRADNKFCLFRLQISILRDLLLLAEERDDYKKTLSDRLYDQSVTEEELNGDKKYIESEIAVVDLVEKALREIIDGLAWRYFKYNRPILYLLADIEEHGPLRLDPGFIKTIDHFAEIFLGEEDKAIINDISNFLRSGDITHIDADGNIELIEVKSRKKGGGRRITRQKQRMVELVEFFNTGIAEYDNKKITIVDSSIKMKNHFAEVRDSILRARNKGYDSIAIGDYLIVHIGYFGKQKDFDINKMYQYFGQKQSSIKQKWEKRGDIILRRLIMDKLRFIRNYVPFSIFPFDDEICADVMMGKLMIEYLFNFSEVIRIVERSGWIVMDSIASWNEKQLETMTPEERMKLSLLKVRKGKYMVNVPPAWIGMLKYEFWSVKSLIQALDEGYQQDPNVIESDASLTNFLDDQRIWK